MKLKNQLFLKIISFLIVICLFLWIVLLKISKPRAPEVFEVNPDYPASLSLETTSTDINTSTQFNVNIIIDTGNKDTVGTDAIIYFNPSYIAIEEVNNTETYTNFIEDHSTPGKITIGAYSISEPYFNGQAALATITFTAQNLGNNIPIYFDFNESDLGNTTDSNVSAYSEIPTTDPRDLLGAVNDLSINISSSEKPCIKEGEVGKF